LKTVTTNNGNKESLLLASCKTNTFLDQIKNPDLCTFVVKGSHVS
jgi:hypothetical protein